MSLHGLKVFLLHALTVRARLVVVVDEEAAVRGERGACQRERVVAVARRHATHGEQGVEHAVALGLPAAVGVEVAGDVGVTLTIRRRGPHHQRHMKLPERGEGRCV